jgi:hypothetical protein
MSSTLKRLSTVGAAGGAALVLFAGPALAGPSASITASGGSATPAGASTAASVTDEGVGPATTGSAAAAVGFRVSNARCFSNDVSFNANTFETGFSGVQRFQQRAQLQEFTTRGWVNATGVSTATSTRFPNDGRSFQFNRHWDGRHVANGASWRVKWQGVYLNGGGAAIARTKIILVTCR